MSSQKKRKAKLEQVLSFTLGLKGELHHNWSVESSIEGSNKKDIIILLFL